MSASLVGSEMCIRDRCCSPAPSVLLVGALGGALPRSQHPLCCQCRCALLVVWRGPLGSLAHLISDVRRCWPAAALTLT
eukprot:1811875-Alexandrium_andersonii.AAC.1